MRHFKKLGSPLRSISSFPTPVSQVVRYRNLVSLEEKFVIFIVGHVYKICYQGNLFFITSSTVIFLLSARLYKNNCTDLHQILQEVDLGLK